MRRIKVGDTVCAHLDASYRGKVLEILSIENVVDPEDEYNKFYEDCEKLYPEMPKA